MAEQKNGLEGYFVTKGSKKLRYGYTTGSCAAAAAKAATWMLLSQKKIEKIDLLTPRGILLHLMPLDVCFDEQQASCAIRKDGGDDPDATDGLLVYAVVSKCGKTKEEQVFIDGGKGVGRITKPGLEQPVGAAAINRVPREMITEAVREVCEMCEYSEGIKVCISIPGGEEVAKKTFNPRLGIEGGLSVLGTSGIVVPMSEKALIASIRLEMEMKRKNGAKYLLLTPGNYGADFVKENTKFDVESSMKCSNYVGETLDMAVELGFLGVLFVAHIGKFVKVSGGIMNTHSREADCRVELLAAAGLRAGVSRDNLMKILDSATTTEAIAYLEEEKKTKPVMEYLMERIIYYTNKRAGGKMKIECILYDNQYGELAKSKGAEEFLHELQHENVTVSGTTI